MPQGHFRRSKKLPTYIQLAGGKFHLDSCWEVQGFVSWEAADTPKAVVINSKAQIGSHKYERRAPTQGFEDKFALKECCQWVV